MKKAYLLGAAVAALAAGMYVQGCSGSSGNDGGSGTACAADTDCPSTEACDTVSGQCMVKCTSGSDCTPTALCQVNNTGSTTVCACSVSGQCGSGFVCNTVDSDCQQSCTTDSNCQGYATARTCDTTTGMCIPGAAPDAGPSNDCTTDPTLCTGGTHCDSGSKTCEAGASCATPDAQDTCPYGQYCAADTGGTFCGLPFSDTGNCPAVNSPPASDPTTVGPVIFSVTVSSATGSDPVCVDANTGNALNVVTYAVSYYDGSVTDLPTTQGQLYSAVMYVKPDGTEESTFKTVTNDGSTVTFQICSPTPTIHAGVVLIGASGTSNTGCIPF